MQVCSSKVVANQKGGWESGKGRKNAADGTSRTGQNGEDRGKERVVSVKKKVGGGGAEEGGS